MSYWYDRQGRVLVHLDVNDPKKKWLKDMTKTEKLLGDMKYKVVGQHYTPHRKYWISTVWLGLDQSFSWHKFDQPNPHPVIFETMVFSGRRSFQKPSKFSPSGYHYRRSFDDGTERYETEEEALAGHNRILAEWTVKEAEERAKKK